MQFCQTNKTVTRSTLQQYAGYKWSDTQFQQDRQDITFYIAHLNTIVCE